MLCSERIFLQSPRNWGPSLDITRFPKVFMGFSWGFPGVFLGFLVFFLVFLGFLWIFFFFPGFSWFLLVFLGFSCFFLFFLVFPGFSVFLVFLGFSIFSWFSRIFRDKCISPFCVIFLYFNISASNTKYFTFNPRIRSVREGIKCKLFCITCQDIKIQKNFCCLLS